MLSACDKATDPTCSPTTRCLPTEFQSEYGLKNAVIRWNYDEEGRLTRKFFSPSSSYLSAYSDYRYDAGGRLLSLQRTVTGHGALPPCEYAFHYNEQGLLVRRDYYRLVPAPPSDLVLVRKNQQPEQYDVYTYNAHNQRIGKQTFRQDGTPVYPHEIYENDERGNLTSLFLTGPETSYLRVSYRYDDKNNMRLWEPDTGDSPIHFTQARIATIPTRDVYPRSPNNVAQAVYYDSTNAVLATVNYAYKYNQQCFPVEVSSPAETHPGPKYTTGYDCK